MLYKIKTFELLELLDIVGIFLWILWYGPKRSFLSTFVPLRLYWTAWDRFHAGVVFG